MKAKTETLDGAALNWAVAVCEGLEINGPYGTDWAFCLREPDGSDGDAVPEYASLWAQGGPIVEREQISIARCNDLYFPKGNEEGNTWEAYYRATDGHYKAYGPTLLVAAMRCFVASKLGEEVEIPEELS